MRANVLQAGVEYTFKLTATYPGQNPGESTVKVAISTPPRGGKIAVTPETGDELETAFTFTAPNWNGDGVPDLALGCLLVDVAQGRIWAIDAKRGQEAVPLVAVLGAARASHDQQLVFTRIERGRSGIHEVKP